MNDRQWYEGDSPDARLVDMLKVHEGLSLSLYRCPADKLTIGYGHNLEDNGIPGHIADALLEYDIWVGRDAAIKAVPSFDALTQVRQDVLTNMGFNLGLPRLLSFKRMRAAIAEGDFDTAAVEMLDSRWADQVGGRAITLSGMMRTGEWADE